MIKVLESVGDVPQRTGLRGWCVILFSALFIFAGCSGNVFEGVSDDDSDDAKLEEARMALDDGEYNQAARILEALLDWDLNDPQDTPEADTQALAYLGHAYAGLAGLDTLDLLDIIDELDKNGDSGSIDMAGLVLGDEEGDVTAGEAAAKLANLNTAIRSIEEIEDQFGSLTDDEAVQRGVLAVARTAMVLAQVVLSDQGSQSVRLTEDGIDALYTGTPDLDGDVSDTQLGYLSDDIEAIQEAILALDGIGSDNDLSENFDEFEQDLNSDGGTNITIDEVEQYLGSLAN